MKGTHFSEMSVAKAASLALMLQDRAEPSLLFRRACIAMILQILLTGRGRGFLESEPALRRKRRNAGVRWCVTLL